MTIIDLGKAQLKQPKPKADKKRLREFLANTEQYFEEKDYESPETTVMNCIEQHGYKKTKLAFEWAEQQLITESKNIFYELGKVLDKNKRLSKQWAAFNKRMGETPEMTYKSLPKKKTEKTESPAEDILAMIRKRQNEISK